MRARAVVSFCLTGCIRIYQLAVSPLFPRSCRFEPSCSQYGIEAISEHGPVKGAWLALSRIARCHPFSSFGPDPVPRGERRGS